MFDKIRDKSPFRHDKKESNDKTNTNDQWPAVAPAYTAASSSLAPPAPTAFQTTFASLSMHMDDRLRFLRFPPPILDECRTTIQHSWPQGIQEERPYASSHEIKLHGYPWRGMSKESAAARRLLNAVLATLHRLGWVLTLNTDVSKTAWDKDTLIFRHQTPAPAPCDWCCVSFSRNDRIRFIDAPGELYAALPEKLGPRWIKEQGEYAPGVWEIKLHGYPWSATGTETMRVRELLLVLVETMEEEGWSVYASIDQKSSGGDNTSETDTWHCCRPRGWVKGAPVYHH